MSVDQGLFAPAILGILEGLTEFIPVSSTAHLLLAAHFLGFNRPGQVFEVLVESPILICSMLIIGGIILLYVDQLKLTPKYTSIYEYPPLLCLYIGLFQVLSLVPGVSRSGSTIVGSLLLGTDKRSAAEFSFFVAIPLMIGAFALDFWKNRSLITTEAGLDIAIGFALAFISAFFVVRYALDFIQRHGFTPFAYRRIFVGALGLWGVLLFK